MNKILIATVIAFGSVSMAHAKDEGHGKVTFSGSIVEAPCSIDPESEDQTVKLGQISQTLLSKGGKSDPEAFSINLENCAVTANGVAVTFDGIKSDAVPGLLAIGEGTAKGAAVGITRYDGTPIELGVAVDGLKLDSGDNQLKFAAYMQGTTASEGVTAGDFKSEARFTLKYN
ncbi:TPA: fimbrial protein [Serratia fonticola]